MSVRAPAKFIAFAALEAGAGRSLCAANVVSSLSKRSQCLALDLGPDSRNFLTHLEKFKFSGKRLALGNLAADALSEAIRSSTADYIVATLPVRITDDNIEIFASADVPIIVTHPGSEALDKVVEFLQQYASRGFDGRRLYVVLNRIQRSGEEKVCAALLEKASASLGLDVAILGTLPHGASPVAFENLAFQIERLRSGDPVGIVRKDVKTPPKEKTRTPQTARLSAIDKRIDDLEGTIVAHRNEINRLQEQIGLLEGSSRASGKAFPKSRYLVPLAGAGLALLALLAFPPLLKPRPEVQQIASAQIPSAPEPGNALEPVKSAAPPKVRVTVNVSVDPFGNVSEAVFDSSEPRPKPRETPPIQDAVVHKVLPDVPQSARDTIRGKVRVAVRASVDPSGNVTEAVLDSSGPSRYFANLAMDAARSWKFTMSHAEGRTAPREWILRFEFGNETTNAFAEPVT